MYSLSEDHPAPLVDREDRIELKERIDAAGEVVYAPKAAEIDAAIDDVLSSGAAACAIGFLFSFRNSEHEKQVADVLRRRTSDITVSISPEVQPEIGRAHV